MRLLKAEDLAGPDYFDVPVSTVYEWNRRHGWPHVRIGNRIRWTPDQVDEILSRHSTVAKKTAPTLPGQTSRSAGRSK